MADIVERLRDWHDYEPVKMFGGVILKDIDEAADEIERLRADLKSTRRTIWCIVYGLGVNGRVMIFPRDLDRYPGDDRAAIEQSKDPITGNTIFAALNIHHHSETK